MTWLIDAAPWIGAIAAIVVVGASVVVAIGDKEEAREAAERDQRIIELQAQLQAETQEVTRRQDQIIALQAELREESDQSVAYLRGDDSHIFVAYGDLNRTNQHVKLIQAGPNPVWDVTVQAYALARFPTRNEMRVSELASSLFRFDDAVLHPGRTTTLVRFPIPDANDRTTWDRHIEIFTRSGTYTEFLLLDRVNGEWSQGYIVFFAKKDGRAGIMHSWFDETFPRERRGRAETLVDSIIANAGQAQEVATSQ